MDVQGGTITIDSAFSASVTSSILGSPNYTIGAVGSSATGPYITTTNNTWGGYNQHQSKGLQVSGDADFEGDVKIKGVSIAKALEDIQKRLAILVPDPDKLEHFEALKKAYDHYKVLESLCELPTETKE
jgi:hypothetical protein